MAEEPVKRKRGRPPKSKEPKKEPVQVDTYEKAEAELVEFDNARKSNTGGILFAPSKTIMTDDEIDAMTSSQLMQTQCKHNIYSENTDKSDKINSLVGVLIEDLFMDAGKRVHLKDTEQVQRVAFRYFTSCQRNGVLPSFNGLSNALGVTVQGLNKFIRGSREHPTSEFLIKAKDGMAETLSNAMLSGAVYPIGAMFLLKSNYQYRENAPIEPEAVNALPEATTTEELMEKYATIDTE